MSLDSFGHFFLSSAMSIYNKYALRIYRQALQTCIEHLSIGLRIFLSLNRWSLKNSRLSKHSKTRSFRFWTAFGENKCPVHVHPCFRITCGKRVYKWTVETVEKYFLLFTEVGFYKESRIPNLEFNCYVFVRWCSIIAITSELCFVVHFFFLFCWKTTVFVECCSGLENICGKRNVRNVFRHKKNDYNINTYIHTWVYKAFFTLCVRSPKWEKI